METSTARTLPTIGTIAEKFGVSVHRVEYLVKARKIQPVARAGNARIFSEADVQRLESELRRLSAEKEATNASS